MTILSFDTSSAVLSVTLRIDREKRQGDDALHRLRDTGLHHAEHLAVIIREILAEAGMTAADLDLIGVAGGPGSFTGLRIGMATAKGFQAARGTPFVAVPTLDVWAELYAFWPGVVVPVMDARKQRFYAGLYRYGGALTGPLDESPRDILARAVVAAAAGASEPGILICGPDAAVFRDTDAFRGAPKASPPLTVAPAADVIPSHALARLARRQYEETGPAAADIGPTYVRQSDAELGR
jgi:tRNA threonylcarbamoyladenosine biosynthesis protein TsaB